ncbi:MAG: hypothetical protein M0Z28_13360 [Rhodospirillales bacterium]|nr:hypothetical protein [Rhodospirillales bacterium]
MTHTLKARRLSPKVERTNTTAPLDAAPKPAPAQGVPPPALAWIARLLARQAAREDYRRLSLGCTIIELPAIMGVIALLLFALMAFMRHRMGH